MEKLYLDTVLKIKEKLTKDIDSDMKAILSFMTAKEVNVNSYEEQLLKKQAQFIIIKEVIQKANTKKHRDGKTNNFYIFRLSNLKEKKLKLLFEIKDDPENQWSNEIVTKKIKEIDKEIDEIRRKLSIFNKSQKVRVELDPELELLTAKN